MVIPSSDFEIIDLSRFFISDRQEDGDSMIGTFYVPRDIEIDGHVQNKTGQSSVKMAFGEPYIETAWLYMVYKLTNKLA